MISEAEAQRGSPIYLIGWGDRTLSEAEEAAQAELFDGLYIGSQHEDYDEILDMLRGCCFSNELSIG